MDHDDRVFAALAYRRNVGATNSDIRTFLRQAYDEYCQMIGFKKK